jgi:hypothetical protein
MRDEKKTVDSQKIGQKANKLTSICGPGEERNEKGVKR